MAIQIPAPLPGDSDKVVSLLRNAALFGRAGDTEEALRWLREAVECAGDSGDDARTLVLAQRAAELSAYVEPGTNPHSDGESGVRERRLPTPPPRSRPPESTATAQPSASSKADASDEEPVLLLRRTARHSKTPSQAPDSAAARPAASAPEHSAAEGRAPDSRSTLTPPPLPSERVNGFRPALASTRPAPTPARPAPPSLRSSNKPAASSRPVVPSSRAQVPASSRSLSLRSQGPVAGVAPSLRQAARVSVERSSSEPGLLLVRLLEEGKSADPGCTEALLVAIDPHARPFG